MNWDLVLNALVVLAGAMVLGAVAERLKQSSILGFIAAGLLLGPNVSGVIADDDTIRSIASTGVVLLLFTIGLEFSWSRLKKMGATAVVGGGLQVAIGTLAGGLILWLTGDGFAAGLALGVALAMSSTSVVLSALGRRGQVDSPHGRFCLAVLLMQDAAVVPAMLLINALAGTDGPMRTMIDTAVSTAIIVGFALFFAAFARYVLPLMLRFVAPLNNRDMPVLFAIIACLGAAWAAQAFGLSAALGAFLAAIFIGESVIAPQLRSDLAPFRVVFLTLFFASIGMMADPVWMWENIGLVLLGTAAVMFGKAIIVYPIAKFLGLPHGGAVASGLCLGQVGVFSFVLADQAVELGVMPRDYFDLVVSVTITTLVTTPFMVDLAVPAGLWWERRLRTWGLAGRARASGGSDEAVKLSGHVIVVGFGPAGRAVASRVYRHGSPVVVLDLSMPGIHAAREAGYRGYVGDASNPEMLKLANIESADTLVVTLPDHRLTVAVIIEARQLAPKARVVARSRYHRYVPLLEAAGADVVVDEEATAGEQLAESLRLSSRTELSVSSDDPDTVLRET